MAVELVEQLVDLARAARVDRRSIVTHGSPEIPITKRHIRSTVM
jgi:hypothetical protein